MKAEIIAIGSEMLTPFRQDTNSLFLTQKLNELGVDVRFKTIVGDSLEDLTNVIRTAVARADIVILSGGLGPTEDDLTREAVAVVLHLEIHRDPEVVAWIEKRFAQFKLKVSSNNLKQADVLAGATVLPNPNGTAPGQWISGKMEGQNRIVLLLPGPPRELMPMFEQRCTELLRAKVPQRFIATRELKIALMSESLCDSRVAPIYKRYPEVQSTILAAMGEIQLHFKTQDVSQDAAEKRLDELVAEVEDELKDAVFSDNGNSLEQIVGYYLQMRNATLAVAESCTGGLLAERITSVAGSSRYFLGGAVVYSNELKTVMADVPAELIAKHGAVSAEVATALAEGIRRRCSTTFGMGITGIAGPGGGGPEKPVGLVFHALADSSGTKVIDKTFAGERNRIRWFASQQALDMIRRRLM